MKRFSRSPVYVRNVLEEESAVSNDVIKLSGGALEMEKPFKLFDMKKFQQNVNRELKRAFPDRRKVSRGSWNGWGGVSGCVLVAYQGEVLELGVRVSCCLLS